MESAVWKFCQAFAQNPNRGTRLVLFGNNGNGKSKTLRSIKRWIKDRAIDLPLVMHDDNASLCNCLLVNWAEQVNYFKAGNWEIDDMLETDLLMIDDIGAEHDPTKFGLEKLYLILERREFRWTIITTNLSPDAWEHRFERRIADRLFRNFEHVDLSELPSYSTRG
jgi:DNA replication protein DnaC